MSSFRNFACWRADDAYAIINPDADALPDHVFRAIHTEVPIQLRDRPDRPATVVDPETLLKRFLAPRDHVLVPVVGQSGTGKSHLIRWMSIRLPSTDTREVIFVPKAQTNLRDIVRALAELLPEPEKTQLLGELQGAGDSLHGPEAQRTAVLNELHTALQNDRGDPQSGIEPDMEAYLLEGLRAVLNDHHLRRNHFLQDKGFAADLAAHVFERPDRYNPAEQRRTFDVSDLPLAIGGVTRANLDAQQFLSFLLGADDPTRKAAASIVNRHVDRAISRCLNITGDRLIELMLGIRRRMRREGKSLVLLIEDFARLQGLDRALLQSLIEQRGDLCVLRTAFACTTGFYDTIATTVRTRLTFIVDMDVPLGADGGSGVDLGRLTGRYMNALRNGEAALKEGLQGYTGGEADFAVPNRCDACMHRAICHTTFGTADGFGLYPFTRAALEIMADRADPEARQRFKTRDFQKYVLRPVALAASTIEDGRFPDPGILAGLGGVQGFPPAEQRKLEVADQGGWQRRLALLQLWDGEPLAKNLPDDLQGAFGLDRIDLLPTPTADSSTPKPPTLTPGHASAQIDPRVQELTDWNNDQTSLSQRVTAAIRPVLFRAIDEAIDWDAQGLAQTDFRGPTQAFRPASLYFEKQTTTRMSNLVSLTIPANWDDRAERYQTVMALQGLLEAETVGGWTLPGGMEKLACLQECLARWSKEVVRQLREVDAAQANWDPAAAAFAVRVSMALVTGADVSTASNLNVVRAGLGPLGPVTDFAHPVLRSLVADVRNFDKDLLAIITARRSAMKGGQKGDFIDTHALLGAVTALRRSDFIPEPPPSGLAPKPPALQQLAKIVAQLSADLRLALQQEAALRRSWLSEMEGAFGRDVRQAEIIATATELFNELGRLGLPVADVAAAKTAFQQCQYDALVAAVRRLSEPGAERPAELADAAEAVIQASRKLAQAMESALRRAEPELDARLRLAGIDPDAEGITVAELDAALAGIEDSLTEDRRADAA